MINKNVVVSTISLIVIILGVYILTQVIPATIPIFLVIFNLIVGFIIGVLQLLWSCIVFIVSVIASIIILVIPLGFPVLIFILIDYVFGLEKELDDQLNRFTRTLARMAGAICIAFLFQYLLAGLVHLTFFANIYSFVGLSVGNFIENTFSQWGWMIYSFIIGYAGMNMFFSFKN